MSLLAWIVVGALTYLCLLAAALAFCVVAARANRIAESRLGPRNEPDPELRPSDRPQGEAAPLLNPGTESGRIP